MNGAKKLRKEIKEGNQEKKSGTTNYLQTSNSEGVIVLAQYG
jgi:hypothetical protein